MNNAFNHNFFQFIGITLIVIFTNFGAHAQETKKDDILYQGLGKTEGITKIVNDFVPLILADTRINSFFAKMKKDEFSALLVAQFCELAGGPCQYKGKDMYEAHQGMNISNAHFNALAEDLQIAMEMNQIPSSIANKLISKLAPMQRPIVSK
ncbi:group I truncated hemoglobin [Undibacterium macrobrachii]|jgi:hemoglobin|uniref:Group 1 truncated hemoglobin n=1 Tax=Undibacterium macrobrachii TaxID=1119058 RepID=A0ABQ2XIA2_9BURK|nr:group 1 truncated hemoglobin [Undibacterium macrobrachii]GGX18257.1 group 1 truncated hemoglobin [Undibacterium macrobrachii]